MVQHRAPLGLRHRRPGAGPSLRRSPDRRAARLRERLRAPAAACLLYPTGRRRSRQRGRDHGFVGARGADLQIRLRLGIEFLKAARRGRIPLGRRQVLGSDEFSADRRPRRRRDQVRRHDAARRQDGHRRHRSSRHRSLYRLEGGRGAEGRRPRRRLQARGQASQPDHGGLPRGDRSGRKRRAASRDPRRSPGDDPGKLHPTRDPVRPPGLHRARLPYLRHRLGFRGLSDRSRAELEQFGAGLERVPRTRPGRRPLGPGPPHRLQGRQDASGPRVVGPYRLCRLGLGRPRAAIRYDHQRMAHLPRERQDQRVQPVFGIQFSRRHGLQPRLPEPDGLLP